ncbi:MAG: hypothetical protein QXS81_03950 [Candidatus Micrarchaeaceae archaeon]
MGQKEWAGRSIHLLRAFSIVSFILIILFYFTNISLALLFIFLVIPDLILLLVPLNHLSRQDQDFKLPYRTVLASSISFIVFLVSFFFLISSEFVVSSNISFSFVQVLYSIGAAGIALFALIIASGIGIVFGESLGLWRLGVKNGSKTLKYGAVLFALPILDIAGSILLILGLFSLKVGDIK